MSKWDKLLTRICALQKDLRFAIPKHEPIKKVYVEMVKQIVESEAINDENLS